MNKQSKTNNVLKKQLIMELRNNLNVFVNGFMNNTPYDNMIDLLGNDAIHEAVKNNFDFKKMKKGKIEQNQIFEDRIKKYIGWTAEKLMEKIVEKIVELKNIKKMNTGSVKDVKNNISLMMGNLYFRMKLLADFIKPGS